jgi:hypothetical protein
MQILCRKLPVSLTVQAEQLPTQFNLGVIVVREMENRIESTQATVREFY